MYSLVDSFPFELAVDILVELVVPWNTVKVAVVQIGSVYASFARRETANPMLNVLGV
jgi:hypothetical protein